MFGRKTFGSSELDKLNTDLVNAARYGDLKRVILDIDNGADAWEDAFRMATEAGKKNIVEFFIKETVLGDDVDLISDLLDSAQKSYQLDNVKYRDVYRLLLRQYNTIE